MDFVAIDFETANSKRTSACSLGIVSVKNSQIVEKRSWLIYPQPFEFNYFNTLVNGFNENQLRNKPRFSDCWEEIKPYLENQTIVAHNASFDVSVLLNTLDYYNICYPRSKYLCSFKASRMVFSNLLNYSLDTIADSLGISFCHHDALEDAEATAKILIHMISLTGCTCVDDFANNINLRLGTISDSNYSSCQYIKGEPTHSTKSHTVPLSKRITAAVKEFDNSNEFYNKTVVFTGALNGISRTQAYQIVANLGGLLAERITRKTDFLILGQQDYKLLKGHSLSSKTRKAIEYANTGTGIQIVSEADFYKMIGDENCG